jgi:hypothetical protein
MHSQMCRNRRPKLRPVLCAPYFRTEVSVVYETENSSKIFDVPSAAPRPLGSTSVNVQIEIVVRPGLDPGTLGVFAHRPPLSLSIQIWWPTEIVCAPTFSEVLADLKPWLDNWLDLRSIQGKAIAERRGESVWVSRRFSSLVLSGRVGLRFVTILGPNLLGGAGP